MPRLRLFPVPRPARPARGLGARLPLAAACALLAAAGPVQAQLSPYYLTATQSFTRDSNLFREREGQAVVEDTISSTGLAVGLSQPIGRQRLHGLAGVAHNRFDKNSHLDNNSHRVDLGLDWETVAKLSGQVRFNRGRQLASYADTRRLAGTPQQPRNLLTAQDLSARAQYGGTSLWTLEADTARREQSYSAPAYRRRDIEQTSLGVGTRYRPSDLLNFGVSLRHTDGRNPNFNSGDGSNDYERRDLSFTTRWRPSGITALNARLSRTETDHEQVSARDFSGFTGALDLNYRPSGRSSFDVQISRETSDEVLFQTAPDDGDPETPPQTQQVESPLVDSRLTTTLRLNAAYLLSAKIAVDAGLSHSRRRLEEAVPGLLAPQLQSARDRTTALRVGASYAVNRALVLGCNIARERRTADTAPPPLLGSGTAITAPFRATTTSCLAQLTLQ